MLAYRYTKKGCKMVSDYQDSFKIKVSPDNKNRQLNRYYISVRCFDNSEFELSLNQDDIEQIKRAI